MNDLTGQLQEQIHSACEQGSCLEVIGSGSKRHLGRAVEGTPLNLSSHRGIIEYQPSELVIRVRAGTPLQEIEQTLAENNQQLASEPLLFSAQTSVGGAVAAGLDGPSAFYLGNISDHILGCKIINGKGELLHFGGTVIKNVAGYDISRLMVGSMGCLGVLTELNLRVIPATETEMTLIVQQDPRKYQVFINELSSKGLPVSGTALLNNMLHIRFSSSHHEIETLGKTLVQQVSGEIMYDMESRILWRELRTLTLPFFQKEKNLWMFSVTPSIKIPDIDAAALHEWNGARRWFFSEQDAMELHAMAEHYDANATLLRASNNQDRCYSYRPLPEQLLQWHKSLKYAFDPNAILNRGRMYEEM